MKRRFPCLDLSAIDRAGRLPPPTWRIALARLAFSAAVGVCGLALTALVWGIFAVVADMMP